MTDQDETKKTVAPEADVDEGDVEGHLMARVDGGADDFLRSRIAQPRIDGDDEDVEGHFGHLKSPSSRGE
ncbi:MAG: hypothetical protein M3P84_12335 [Chloroflexota bacterium]|nr:hypothetical protein [Chloroflexota bacterium]